MLKINTHYDHKVTSEMLNDKVYQLLGGNGVFSGFQVSSVSSKSLRVEPGTCAILGAFITETSDAAIVNIKDEYLQNGTKLNVLIDYNHYNQSISMRAEPYEYKIKNNELLLAIVTVLAAEASVVLEVRNSAPIRTITGGIAGDEGGIGGGSGTIPVYETVEEMMAVDRTAAYIGLLAFCAETKTYHTYRGEGVWEETIGNTSIYIGGEEPVNRNLLWVDDVSTEGEINYAEENPVITELINTIKGLSAEVDRLKYAFDYEMNMGTFEERKAESEPGEVSLEGGELPEGSELPTEVKRNIRRFKMLGGYKADLPLIDELELAICKDTTELYTMINGRYVLLNPKSEGGGDSIENITTEYIDLLSTPSKKRYRITIDDTGEFEILDMSIEDQPDPDKSQTALFNGLIINQFYGGGMENTNTTVCSHGFIELYNSTAKPMSLKGLSIHYAGYNEPWQTLNLKGVIPAESSFLIRGKQHSNPDLDTVKIKVTDYDMHWDIPFTDKGMKVYLGIGRNIVGPKNPWDINATNGINPVKEAGYIDLLGAGGADVTRTIDGYEKAYAHIKTSSVGVRRKDFQDKDNNATDCVPVDFSTCDPIIYRPRTTKDGRWNVYFDKRTLDPMQPNLLVMGYGQDAHTTRTFTWQTLPTYNQYLLYKRVGAPDWIRVPTVKTVVQHHDTDATKHSVIIHGLTDGDYVYKAGEEDKWSPEYTFTVKTPVDEFEFVQVTDQQGWYPEEYAEWTQAAEYILANEKFDFVINTGDFSQNGNRAFEWRDYFAGAATDLHAKYPLMGTIGNNDLVEKKYSYAFTYYFTMENPAVVNGAQIISCHTWEYGDCWFCCMNSNEMIDEQITWFVEEIQKTTKRWKIVYIHDAPYTISSFLPDGETIKRNDSKAFPMAPYFEQYGVHLCICGHKHNYMRSKPITNAAVDYERGVYYVMSNATGYKLSSNKDIPCPDWYYASQVSTEEGPQYIKWKVTRDKIIGRSYKLLNVKSPDSKVNEGKPYKVSFDAGHVSMVDDEGSYFEIPYQNK